MLKKLSTASEEDDNHKAQLKDLDDKVILFIRRDE